MVFNKKHCIEFEHCTPQTLQAALVCATQHHRTLTCKQIAERAEIKLADLYAYSREGSGRHIPAEKLVRLVEITGRVDLIRFLVAPLGFTVVQIAEASTADHLRNEVMDISIEAGELTKFTRDALPDGIDEHELESGLSIIRKLETETAEAKQALIALAPRRAAVHAMAGGGSR